MIFLKRFIANGFKSFASHTQIDFSSGVSGIIGPNGSGKSNVVDALKWVLGEKSNKTLRGKTSDDVIFHGSKGHEKSMHAEVTLVFSNENRVLHYDGDEVSICRRLTRGEDTNEYFINGEPCRLRDIQEIFLDTGLSKGSLGIISQNTVQWFVEAKPEERRTIFEEAAGIGLYTRKKEESLSQLSRTNENLDKICSIVSELKSDLDRLEKQASKAKEFNEKKKQLSNLEISTLVKDIVFYQTKLVQINEQIKEARNELDLFEPERKQIVQSLQFAKEKLESSDQNIEIVSKEFAEIVNVINKIEIKKSSLDFQLMSDLTSENIQKKAEAYKEIISTTNFEISNAEENISKLTGEIEAYREIVDQISKKRTELSDDSSRYSTRLTECRMKIKSIEDALSYKGGHDIGVRAVIENKNALTGIHGLVKNFLTVNQDFEKAIVTALGKNLQSVIVNSNDDVDNAVDFLKRNRSGKATFLPLMTIKKRGLKEDHHEILKTCSGYLGVASDLIDVQDKYKNIFSWLLGTTIVADNIQNGMLISKFVYQMYRIVTLDGDVILPGGAVTGGYNRVNQSLGINLEEKQRQLEVERDEITEKLLSFKIELDKVISEHNEISAKQNEKKILLCKYEEIKRSSENQLCKYEMDYQLLVEKNNLSTISTPISEQTLNESLAKLTFKKEKLNEQINADRQAKIVYKSQVEDFEAKLNELQNRVFQHKDQLLINENDRIRCENVIQNAHTRISETYKMTIDYAIENYSDPLPMSDQQAREIITTLQFEIDKLGNINMTAIEEMEEKQKRYDDLFLQQVELETAKANIEKVIEELDVKAREDFSETINEVNDELPKIFKYLFGGGTCTLEYTNPEDILASGIDVLANPPGKNIVHLNLLSGGEKTLVALSILFAILQKKAFPLVVLDEAESALDPANVERFGNIIKETGSRTQFIVITHRPGTMERCDNLYGATMQTKGVTSMFKVSLGEAKRNFTGDNDGAI